MRIGHHPWTKVLAGKVTAPMVLSAALAVSIFLDEFLAIAAVLAGAALILAIVRSIDQRNEPFDEIAEIVIRSEAQDSAWIDALCRKQHDANASTLRIWRQYACALWMFLAALIIKLGFVAFVPLFQFLQQIFYRLS